MNDIQVTYRYGAIERVYHDGTHWFCDAPWMPAGTKHAISVTPMGLEMMVNEKEEGPSIYGEGDNARRFYHKVVAEDLCAWQPITISGVDVPVLAKFIGNLK